MEFNKQAWLKSLLDAPVKKAMPVLSFPSTQLMGITVAELIGSAELQARGMKLIADRVPSLASVSMMDLSVEAEAFGAQVTVSDHEVPTVSGILLEDEDDADRLAVPPVGAGRTGRYIEAIRQATELITDRPVFAGVIGPYSLCGRLMGVSEVMINCYTEPDMVHKTMRKCTDFLKAYCAAYRDTGCAGIVMAEPLTGMLSPDLAAEFSEPYVREIVEYISSDSFAVIYHNCGDNTILMIDSILRVNADAYHFGDAIDMAEMLTHIPSDVIAMGNVSPSREFFRGTPESIRESTLKIMEACCPGHANFVISSGCDIPPMSPWENTDAFFAAVSEYYER